MQFSTSPSPRRAWIEIITVSVIYLVLGSPSPRRAWIEIPLRFLGFLRDLVALPTEGVD